jgi:hypothetical protein
MTQDFGIVPGFTNLRDCGIDEKGQRRILDAIADTPGDQPLDVESYQALAREAIVQINSGELRVSGFQLILNILDQFYKSNGDAAYADIANSLLRHIHLGHPYDVMVDPEDDLLNEIKAALASVETQASYSTPSQPHIPRRSRIQIPSFIEPASCGLKAQGSTIRIVAKDEAYLGSPTKSGQKKPILIIGTALERSASTTISGVSMHAFALPASPRVSRFQISNIVPSCSFAQREDEDKDEESQEEQDGESQEGTDTREVD